MRDGVMAGDETLSNTGRDEVGFWREKPILQVMAPSCEDHVSRKKDECDSFQAQAGMCSLSPLLAMRVPATCDVRDQ